jgi:hypothetical protein
MAFHVPEAARDTTHYILATTPSDGNNGAFNLESPEPGWRLAVLCSDGTDPDVPDAAGWEHVSIHAHRDRGRQMRTPTWKEMAYVKAICWDDEDLVIQYHPRKSEYVNNHPHVLHLWRYTLGEIPTPPPLLVGVLR